MYPVNSVLSFVYFKKIPLYLKININLLDVNNDQISLVHKIHDFFINSANFSTISNIDVVSENINISNNDIARGEKYSIITYR